jgi:hypothetical protein
MNMPPASHTLARLRHLAIALIGANIQVMSTLLLLWFHLGAPAVAGLCHKY